MEKKQSVTVCPIKKNEISSNYLLYRAARNGLYGQRSEYASSSITDAMFVYLDGAPSPESINALDKTYRLKPLVCLTDSWETFIKENHPDARIFKRYMMKPSCHFNFDSQISLPDGFDVSLFDENAFEIHPFSHGENYPSFAAFQKEGAGAVVWHNQKIVASASSFLTFNHEIELDISTEEAYRGKGLATACLNLMLRDCQERGIRVHWDAQNEISLHLAEKFGFTPEGCYSVYVLPGK